MTAFAVPAGDTRALKVRLNASLRRRKARALLLVAPLLVFVALVFLGPIYLLLERSVAVPEMPNLLARTSAALADWDASALPAEEA